MKVLTLFLLALPILFAASVAFTHFYARRVERLYPPKGRFIEVDGLRLHYVDVRPDTQPLGTVVLFHGASSNLTESMLGMGSSLAARYRVIAFDRPGQGWSERGAGEGRAPPNAKPAFSLRRSESSVSARRLSSAIPGPGPWRRISPSITRMWRARS